MSVLTKFPHSCALEADSGRIQRILLHPLKPAVLALAAFARQALSPPRNLRLPPLLLRLGRALAPRRGALELLGGGGGGRGLRRDLDALVVVVALKCPAERARQAGALHHAEKLAVLVELQGPAIGSD